MLGFPEFVLLTACVALLTSHVNMSISLIVVACISAIMRYSVTAVDKNRDKQ